CHVSERRIFRDEPPGGAVKLNVYPPQPQLESRSKFHLYDGCRIQLEAIHRRWGLRTKWITKNAILRFIREIHRDSVYNNLYLEHQPLSKLQPRRAVLRDGRLHQ